MYYRLLLFLLAGACLLRPRPHPSGSAISPVRNPRGGPEKSLRFFEKRRRRCLDAGSGRSGRQERRRHRSAAAGKLAGKYVTFEAEIAYRNVTYPVGAPWNGVKFMASFLNGEGRESIRSGTAFRRRSGGEGMTGGAPTGGTLIRPTRRIAN